MNLKDNGGLYVGEGFSKMEKEDKQMWEVSNGGYDVAFVLGDVHYGKLVKSARVEAEESGITMEVYTNMPGLVFYTGNWIGDNTKGRNDSLYNKYSG